MCVYTYTHICVHLCMYYNQIYKYTYTHTCVRLCLHGHTCLHMYTIPLRTSGSKQSNKFKMCGNGAESTHAAFATLELCCIYIIDQSKMYVHTCALTHTCKYVHIQKNTNKIHIYINIYMYKYIYVNIHVYTYICIYIHI